MPYVVGNIIVKGLEILDGAGAPLSGITSPAGITLTLQRQSGGAMAAATEPVSFAEIGVTGRYYFSFTPTQSGAYVCYTHIIDPGANNVFQQWDFEVYSAGAVFLPAYANAFCAESDIERWTQTAIDATTRPNDTAAAAFAETRAAQLASLCYRFGVTVPPVTVGSRLEDLLREANAIGAALDYTIAQQFGDRPSLSDKPERLQLLWEQYTSTVEGEMGIIIGEVKNTACLSTDHILSGDTQAAPSTGTPVNAAIGVTMGDLF